MTRDHRGSPVMPHRLRGRACVCVPFIRHHRPPISPDNPCLMYFESLMNGRSCTGTVRPSDTVACTIWHSLCVHNPCGIVQIAHTGWVDSRRNVVQFLPCLHYAYRVSCPCALSQEFPLTLAFFGMPKILLLIRFTTCFTDTLGTFQSPFCMWVIQLSSFIARQKYSFYGVV